MKSPTSLFKILKIEKERIRKIKRISLSVILIASFSLSLSLAAPKQVSAQVPLPVTDLPALAQDRVIEAKKTVMQRLWEAVKKAGSIAFNRTLQTSLNKIAYDAANYIGSGGDGQKPLFRTEGLGEYLGRIGDEAAGQFLETFVRNLNYQGSDDCGQMLDNCLTDCYYLDPKNTAPPTEQDLFELQISLDHTGADISNTTQLGFCIEQCKKGATSCATRQDRGFARDTGFDASSFNVCQPSSIEAKLRIGLGLVEQSRPQGPNCTATEIVSNWGDDIGKKIASYSDPNYLANIEHIFDPRSNDVGIFYLARTDLVSMSNEASLWAMNQDLANQGWIDVRNIAGQLEGPPGEARAQQQEARDVRIQNFGKTTGDIFVDAANLFLNQLAVSAYNNLMRTIADRRGDAGASLADPAADPGVSVGETSMREKTRILIETNFESKTDYSVLAELAVCPDPNNPGPNNCAIDDRFMQAIIEQKTVGEAIKEGYLNPNWRIEKDVYLSAYNNHYSLRNIKILRKYRVLPVGWEVAIERAFENENIDRQATLGDLVSCFSKSDDYENFSSGFNINDTSWCEGLVDPNWVLKAPSNYCASSGYGGHVLNMMTLPGVKGAGEGYDTLSKTILTRGDNYCADLQSCIKENNSGGCDAYGYCTEDRRTWSFDSSSCNPINSTCQTFANVSTNAVASYLENTIDYGSCDADAAGCRRYSLSGTYNTSGSISWNYNNNILFNKNLTSCSPQNEGCTELMRVKPTWGSNLVLDPNFAYIQADSSVYGGEKLGAWVVSPAPSGSASVVDIDDKNVSDYIGSGNRAIEVLGSDMAQITSSVDVFPENLQILPRQNYTLSADVRIESGDRVEVRLNPGDNSRVEVVNQNGYWQRVSITSSSISGLNAPVFSFAGYGTNPRFYVKNIKFELGDWQTSFSNYGGYKVYQKLIPDYLEPVCYESATFASKNYQLKENAPSVCYDYTRKCNQDEVGCNLFTNTLDGYQIPAQVTSADYCPGECVGYDLYIAKQTFFNPAEPQNLIPDRAERCSFDAVGCNEFTNLDEVARGGEGKEYYSQLRQCIKPNVTECATFYTWESSAGGYEIKTYSLQKDVNGNPKINFGDQAGADCSDVFGLPLTDPRYNPDCREFRNNQGEVSYRLESRVITCSENCHTYRLTGNNVHPTARNQEDCNASSDETFWSSANSSCYVCQNGGVWDTNQNACIYQAIPGEGKVCRVDEVGCREYNGNQGNDVRVVSTFNFENGLGGWQSNCTDGISISPIANTQSGSSLAYNADASNCSQDVGRSIVQRLIASNDVVAKYTVGNRVRADRAYTIKFLARSSVDSGISIYFKNENTGDRYDFGHVSRIAADNTTTIIGGNEWRIYNFNLENLPALLGTGGTLNISASADILIDDIVLTEISNRYYFVKDTIVIPDICYYDNLGVYRGGDYNLGCSQYRDRDNLVHNIHNFSKLCSSSSVGCEQMIYTQNYSLPFGNTWNTETKQQGCVEGSDNCISVLGDEIVYAVYDRSKSCSSSDAGCSRMGEAVGTGTNISWSDVYRVNNPDMYFRSLCSEDDLGCEEYRNTSDGSLSYFKNPINNLCVYRNSKDPAIIGKAWYRTPVKRCDVNNNGVIDSTETGSLICTNDDDCGVSIRCIVDNNDYACPVTYNKTIGYGGVNNATPVPVGSVGLCDAASAGCTEFIDPVSKFNPNIVSNPGSDGLAGDRKGWGSQYNNDPNWYVTDNDQIVSLKRNKLYALMAINKETGAYDGTAKIDFKEEVYILDENNNLVIQDDRIRSIEVNANSPYVIFNSKGNYSARLFNPGTIKNHVVELRELAISYNIKGEVDSSSCNGVANFDSGCVVFNERSIAGASGYSKNVYNAVVTDDGKAPVANYGPYNANQLIKVRPDRDCAAWLSCTSYMLDESGSRICTSVAECNALGDNNECANYIIRPEQESLDFDPEKNRNATGYALINNYYYYNIKEVGLNTKARYDFEEAVPALSCYQSNINGYPIRNSRCSFDRNIITDNLVREPEGSPVKYPASGRTYLRVFPNQAISPQSAGSYVVLPEEGDYYLTLLVNTKNSSAGARVMVIDVENKWNNYGNYTESEVLSNETIISPNGWKREVIKFSTTKNDTKIRIYLSAVVVEGGASAVYFDDVNIEPVLEVAEGIYSSRDCRLYPTSSALGCQEIDNSVVRNGVEGYCLEYDLANPSVCQLWMPIDRISSARISSNQLGYSGKLPLNYCAEVNTDFVFLEKRMMTVVQETSEFKTYNKWFGQDNPYDMRLCYYPSDSPANDYCFRNFVRGASAIPVEQGLDISARTEGEYRMTRIDPDPDDENQEVRYEYDEERTLEIVGRTPTPTDQIADGQACITEEGRNGIGWEKNRLQEFLLPFIDNTCLDYDIHRGKVQDSHDSDLVENFCGDSGNYFVLVVTDRKRERGARDEMATTVMCVPINHSGYWPDRPDSTYRYVPSQSEPILTFSESYSIRPTTDGWYLADGFHSSSGQPAANKRSGNPGGFDELSNANPPLRVLDLNRATPAGEDDLYKLSSNNPDEVFRLTCNKFVEVVSGYGDNMAWADRIAGGSDYEIGEVTIGNEGGNPVSLKYNGYIRNIGDIPFGAASWPDNFNLTSSERVNLYNQYSAKNNENIFAGRPYGCDASTANGLVNCTRMGYCSGNPDVYCLIDSSLYAEGSKVISSPKLFNENTYDISRHSCGAWGECKPLWTSTTLTHNSLVGQLENYSSPLSQLFLQAPVAYEYDTSSGGYTSTTGYFSSIPSGQRPVISNESLYRGHTKIPAAATGGIQAGNYRLEFNIKIDSNRQPLKEIFIDWGDGYKQVITGQDAIVAAGSHSFYHFYASNRTHNSTNIQIRAYDNWGGVGETTITR